FPQRLFMAFVKICGITNLEDALLSVAAGADALGFNFYGPSPRYIEPRAARDIIDRLPANVLTVGVFVNQPTPETVERIASDAGVTALQLHGDESPGFCRALRGRYVIKVLAAGDDFEPQRALDYQVEAIMLDTFDAQLRGGTGRIMDWSVARKTRELVPRLFLAGGLAAENVRNAIAEVDPYGVDACSKLESSPGKKVPERVAAFVNAARSA
ncbi:MAG: phosphoribosylanthranilate isomerase, partial [Pyrinomonadaceae bacterium]|nr:phosphoribosylanthranilate isomerase [Pyrinomonadaceae bacterium]